LLLSGASGKPNRRAAPNRLALEKPRRNHREIGWYSGEGYDMALPTVSRVAPVSAAQRERCLSRAHQDNLLTGRVEASDILGFFDS